MGVILLVTPGYRNQDKLQPDDMDEQILAWARASQIQTLIHGMELARWWNTLKSETYLSVTNRISEQVLRNIKSKFGDSFEAQPPTQISISSQIIDRFTQCPSNKWNIMRNFLWRCSWPYNKLNIMRNLHWSCSWHHTPNIAKPSVFLQIHSIIESCDVTILCHKKSSLMG
jgi:hypothetical protein